jgi:hypothetical protein
MRLGLVVAGALTGFVGTAASARGAPSCSVAALNARRVPDVSVTDAMSVAAAGTTPSYRDVHGTVVTGEITDPANWRCAAETPE